ncbi:MAG: hypothetical protein ACP5E4_01005 [Candidatus Aenigmatarchaeota archaeon]
MENFRMRQRLFGTAVMTVFAVFLVAASPCLADTTISTAINAIGSTYYSGTVLEGGFSSVETLISWGATGFASKAIISDGAAEISNSIITTIPPLYSRSLEINTGSYSFDRTVDGAVQATVYGPPPARITEPNITLMTASYSSLFRWLS